MTEETEAQEIERLGRTAGFMLVMLLLLVAGGLFTAHIDHTLAVSAYFLLITIRVWIYLAIALAAVGSMPDRHVET